jgi:ABC-type transport system involved in multi-copper enzyme maturation permease subunit
MNFSILFFDELKGYIKSKIMIILWFGMPALAILIRFLYVQAETPEFVLPIFIGLIISSIGSTLSSVMLSTSIVSEKNKKVYELFLVRPVKRWYFLLAKFFAVWLCLIIAVFVSYIAVLILDVFDTGVTKEVITGILESILQLTAFMAASCAIGILFGVLLSSVAAAAILSVYLGNQFSSLIFLIPMFLGVGDPVVTIPIIGYSITILIMGLNLAIFNKKQF